MLKASLYILLGVIYFAYVWIALCVFGISMYCLQIYLTGTTDYQTLGYMIYNVFLAGFTAFALRFAVKTIQEEID